MKILLNIAIFLLMIVGQTKAQSQHSFTDDTLKIICQKFAGKPFGSLIRELQLRGIVLDVVLLENYYGMSFALADPPTAWYPWTWEKNPWESVYLFGLEGKLQSQNLTMWINTEYLGINEFYKSNPKFQGWFDGFTDSIDTKLTLEILKIGKERFIAKCGENKYEKLMQTRSLRESGITIPDLEKLLNRKRLSNFLTGHFLEMIEIFKEKMFSEVLVPEFSKIRFGVLPLK